MAKIPSTFIQQTPSGAADIPVVVAVNQDGTDMSGASVVQDGKIVSNLIYQPATGGAKDAMVAVVVNPDGTPISVGGGGGSPSTWASLDGKPPFIAAGASQQAAREVIGAGTSNLVIGTTSDTAMAGNTPIPTWSTIQGKPAVIAQGSTEEEARQSIGALGEGLLGVPGGIATLDPTGSIPLDQINVSSLTFKGAWYPSTNTPELLNGTGNVGDFYKAAEDGTFNFGNGAFEFIEGDWVMFAAGVWQRLGSKETVSSVNGKMGAVVLSATDIGALPDDYKPTWSDILDKPTIIGERGERGPQGIPGTTSWEGITDKPDFGALYQPKNPGTMSPAIPAALLRRSTAATITGGSRQTMPWNEVVYDNFGGVSGNNYIVPSWAKYARVTVFVRLTVTGGDGGYLYAYALKDGVEIGISGRPVIAGTNQIETVISQIVPVEAGDVLTGAMWHSGTSRTLTHGATGVYMQIELFQSIS